MAVIIKSQEELEEYRRMFYAPSEPVASEPQEERKALRRGWRLEVSNRRSHG